MLPEPAECFFPVNGLATLSLSQAARDLLLNFITAVFFPEVAGQHEVINGLVEKTRSGRSIGSTRRLQ